MPPYVTLSFAYAYKFEARRAKQGNTLSLRRRRAEQGNTTCPSAAGVTAMGAVGDVHVSAADSRVPAVLRVAWGDAKIVEARLVLGVRFVQ